jgi:mRNA interferase RelE/StbE
LRRSPWTRARPGQGDRRGRRHSAHPVGDYRILYTIDDDELVVLVVAAGHRREIYQR